MADQRKFRMGAGGAKVVSPSESPGGFGFVKGGQLPEPSFTPTNEGVVFQILSTASTTKSGLHLPDNAVEKLTTPIGWVVAVGPLCKQVKRGDQILVLSNTPLYRVMHEDQELLLCTEDKIVGIIGNPLTDQPETPRLADLPADQAE